MSNILKRFVELFYKKKYRDNECITRIPCFRFKKKVENLVKQPQNIQKLEDGILYENGNKIILHCADGKIVNNPNKIAGLKVLFISGGGHTLEIYEPCSFINGNIIEFHGDPSYCTLKKCQLSRVQIKMQHNAKCFVDENATIGGYIHIANERNLSLTIGKGCMFSGEVAIWTTDGHTIMDASTNEVINRAKNGIVIGNHCWIGHKVTILKNTILPDNTIVGAKSCVSGHFSEPNTIIVGNPAKVIKRNVIWDRKPLD